MAIKISGSNIIDDNRHIVNAGVITATRAVVGSGVTITSGGIIAGVITATSFVGDGSGLTNAGSSLSSSSGTQRVVLTSQTTGSMTAAATDGDLTFDANSNTLNVVGGLNVTGIATVGNIQLNTTTNTRKITTTGGTPLTIEAGSGTVFLDSNVTITGNTSAGRIDAGDVTASSMVVSGISTFSSNVTVSGDLTVNGTTTTINSTTLTVDDKNIELASTASPSDAAADGGGITLKGTSDKTLNWVSSTSAWTSNQDFNLLTGKVYEINGTTVLSSSQVLGKSVPSGTIVGTSDTQTLTNKTLTAYSETVNAHGNTGASATLALSSGNVVTATLTDNCTFTFSTTGLPSGSYSFTLILTNDGTAGRTITWPASVKWPNATVPTRTTTASRTDVYTFFTTDGGTTWLGNLSLYNFS